MLDLVSIEKAASEEAAKSPCKRLQVGAVLFRSSEYILSRGHNRMPRGFPQVCEINPETSSPYVSHAEVEALDRLVIDRSMSAEGLFMYVTHSPCLNCAIRLVRHQVSKVMFSTFYRSDDGIKHLINSGVEVLLSRGGRLHTLRNDDDISAFK